MRITRLRVAACLGGFILLFFTTHARAQTWGQDAKGMWVFDAPLYLGWGSLKSGNSKPSKASINIMLPSGSGPFPAVIVSHASGGWSDRKDGIYAKALRDAGYVVGALDHFGPRGAKSTYEGGSLTVTTMSDALLALNLLASHPKVRADRIGIVGFSMGGEVAEWTNYEQLRGRVLRDTPLKFAAHVGMYASCSFMFGNSPGQPMTTGAPVLRLRAGKDELAPPDKCDRIDAVVRAAEPGAQRETTIYADAYHAWEEVSGAPKLHPKGSNARKCPIIDWGVRERFIDIDGTERPYSPAEFTECRNAGTGYWMGYSPTAAREAPKAMLAFFDKHLKGN
jgi:dienelactone hydrolase